MRVFFSRDRLAGGDFLGKPMAFTPEGAVTSVARAQATKACLGLHAQVTQARDRAVVFKLLDGTRFASPAAHDDVIAALFELDPGAEIRTAKAHYHGLDDFRRQVEAAR